MRFGGREYKTPAHLGKEAVARVNTPYSHAFPRRKGCILFPVFGGEKAAAKIRTVKGLRVEIFSRCARKNTTRPLTVWIGGTAAEAITAIGIIGSVIPPRCFSAVKVLLVSDFNSSLWYAVSV